MPDQTIDEILNNLGSANDHNGNHIVDPASVSYVREQLSAAIDEIIGPDYDESDGQAPIARLAAGWRNNEHEKQRQRKAQFFGEDKHD